MQAGLSSFPFQESGPVAQLGARFHGMEEVVGSNPTRSTKSLNYLDRKSRDRRDCGDHKDRNRDGQSNSDGVDLEPGSRSRTPYAPFSAEIMTVIPPDAAHKASNMPNVTLPPVEFLVTSSIVFERSSKAAGGSTSEK